LWQYIMTGLLKNAVCIARERERGRERETKQYKSTLREVYVSGTYSELPSMELYIFNDRFVAMNRSGKRYT